MTDFLVKHFVKDYQATEKAGVRRDYGILASIVGIFLNFLLFGGKLLIGLLIHSVSIMADAFNNLSDAASALIGFVGIKIANKPADKEHPFGHGRAEYITALVVAFVIMQVGFDFLKDSLAGIKEPGELKFSLVAVIFLGISILTKIWIFYFNRSIGKRIHSQVMMATATDALGDVFATSATAIAVLVYRFWGVNIDGYVGLLVSLFVLWAGLGIARDSVAPLIGEGSSEKEQQMMQDFVESYEGVLGSHDLIIHNYGPGRSMGSVHAEVSRAMTMEEAHELVDRIEKDAYLQLGIYLVIHTDPVAVGDVQSTSLKEKVGGILRELDPDVEIHDFRLVKDEKGDKLIFELDFPVGYPADKAQEIKENVKARLIDSGERCRISIDRNFSRS